MAKKAGQQEAKRKGMSPDLVSLHKSVVDAEVALNKAGTEAEALVDKALDAVSKAARAYREAVALYREACVKGGVECEFSVDRPDNESQKLTFIVGKTDNGVSVLVKEKRGPEDIVPLAILRGSIKRASHVYTDKRMINKDGTKGRPRAPKLEEK
jgi:hypothetical protein